MFKLIYTPKNRSDSVSYNYPTINALMANVLSVGIRNFEVKEIPFQEEALIQRARVTQLSPPYPKCFVYTEEAQVGYVAYIDYIRDRGKLLGILAEVTNALEKVTKRARESQ